MILLPKTSRDLERIDLQILQPGNFIARLMKLSMMSTAQRTVSSSLTLRPIAHGCAKRT